VRTRVKEVRVNRNNAASAALPVKDVIHFRKRVNRNNAASAPAEYANFQIFR